MYFIAIIATQLTLATTCMVEVDLGESIVVKVNSSLTEEQEQSCRKLYCPMSERNLNCIDPDENDPEAGPQDGVEMMCCTTIEIKN